ncbi:choice-of-anchor L domain-containing protein [Psychroserpens sp. XS_ASV72]|uniref:T9SS type B sorting domain-containing protein n=1 Tax=Psychroserpens sp. XS_ASV72 TaxID=3241293 RepID=UPI00351138EC
MRQLILAICFITCLSLDAQNIQVDSQTFSAQQLIEDILIDSNCIENVSVTNVVGGDFNNSDQSYGYFDATGTSFPFQSGIVLSTGRLGNVPGPNTSLSDDNAPDWIGDNDLEIALNESNTLNATIIEFDFTSVATQISFRYIFASEEYQENNPNTCEFSDLFGFLIRPINEQEYTNIALVPDTQTPVKVTTVHPEIPNGCEAQNEFYFESWNNSSAPINFNGQTKVLTATADVVPNQTYHVKLVIADEQNFRYDSAVFLEANSFQLSTDLGPNRLLSTDNALCHYENLDLDASQPNSQSFKWFKDELELTGETNSTYTVTEAGTYNVEVTLSNGCISYGEIIIEYNESFTVFDTILIECDQNQDGLTFYNLFDAESSVTNNNNAIYITDFYLNEADAIQDANAIAGANFFENTTSFQTVFARVENQFRCFDIAEIELQISNNSLNIPTVYACDDTIIDGLTTFDLAETFTTIENQVPNGSSINFYESESDAFLDINPLNQVYNNTIPYNQTIYVKVEANNQCYSIAAIDLEVLYTPILEDDEFLIYCLNSFPETITLTGGVLNDFPNNYYYEWLLNGSPTGIDTSFIDINTPGNYSVIVTHPNGCSSSRNITVTASNIASINTINIVNEGYRDNAVVIEVTGEGVYEYALDVFGTVYQESNVFNNVPPGVHTVYVRDLNNCGVVEKEFSVLGFPKFFTPNGDGFNDTWHIFGRHSSINLGIEISIFNRYGKLLKQLTNTSEGWTGKLNGQALPSDDYWYVAKFSDGRTFTGHFTLKR